MIKKHLATAVGASILSLSLSTSALAAEVTLKLHHMLPPVSFAHKNLLVPWKEAVEKESNGRIEVKIYPSMSLGGKPPQLADQVSDGFVDLMYNLPSYTPGRFPVTSVFELPFMITTAEDTSVALQEFYEKTPEMQAEYQDMHPLFFWVHDRGAVFSKGSPILTAEDFKGRKIRNPSREVATALQELGAIPVGMPIPEAPQALSKGVVDGTVIPFEIVPPFKLHELLDYAVEMNGEDNRGLYTATFVMAMNKDRYNSLPDDLKAVIDNNSGADWARKAGAVGAAAEDVGRKFIDGDAERMQMAVEEVEKIRNITRGVSDIWINDMNERGLDGKALYESANVILTNNSK